MFRIPFVLSIFLLAFAASSSAQVPTGTPPFGSFAGSPDIINLANLNSHITIPVLHKPGRGTSFTYDLSYDSSVWQVSTLGSDVSWAPVPNFGWTTQTQIQTASTGYVWYSAILRYVTCSMGKQYFQFVYSYSYVDPFGTFHPFPGNSLKGGCPGTPPTPLNSRTNDGSGFVIVNAVGYTGTIEARSGKVINAPFVFQTAGATSVTDRNGNQISIDTSGNFTDTLGQTALTVTGTAPIPTTFTYTAPSGANASYTMKYTAYTVQTNFACSGISEYGPTSNNLVSEIDLPDGSKYSFTYEQTAGVSGNVTGRLKSVTLPTGGTVTYVYSGGSNGINCSDGSAATLTRATPDGTWTYAQLKGTGAATTNTITDPQNNQTVIQFQGIYETKRVTYQGSSSGGTLLQTINTCYNGAASPCTTIAITPPITRRTQLAAFPDNTGQVCEHDQFFNTYGLQTEQDDYDYGSGAPTLTALRKLTIVYNTSLTNGIVNLPSSITTQDGNGNTKAQTTFAYDETSVVAPTGASPQHVSIVGSRGNATTIKNLVRGTTFLTNTVSYYDTGNPQTVTDVNNAQTTYGYPDATSTCGNGFPTSVSEPLGLSKSMIWNCVGAVVAQTTDENGQSTTMVNTDSFFWRPASATDPANATINFFYPSSPSYNTLESKLLFNSGNSVLDSVTTLDSLGRPHVRQLKQTPNATNYDSTETDYDALGRPNRHTLPYNGTAGQTSSTAPGVTTTYDALNRVLSSADSGGGSTSYSYNQNDVLVVVGPSPTGENAKQHQLEYDGLGRLTSVCEITGAAGSGACGQTVAKIGYLTKYSYDTTTINSVLYVRMTITQNSQPGGSTQVRTYLYDLYGRLVSETNPEPGTTAYTYDSVVLPSKTGHIS